MRELRPFKGKQLQKRTYSKSRGDIVQEFNRPVLTTIVFLLFQPPPPRQPASTSGTGPGGGRVNSGKFFISSINILGEGF